MLDSFAIYEELALTFDEKSAKVLTKTLSKIYKDMANVVTKEEFGELKEVVSELAEAQKRTEERVEELAEAQKRTEARVEELAEAQRKTEARLDSLTVKVEELAEAQKRTEARVEELAEAQRKTEARLDSLTVKVEELAEAQRKTEEVVRGLVKDMSEVKTRLDGLSDSVGYGLEDKLIPFMYNFVKNKYGLTVKSVERKNITYPDGRFDEINLYVEAKKEGKAYLIIGESKAKPGKRDIKRFLKLKERVTSHFSDKKVKAFIVGYNFHPEVEKYLNNLKEIDYFKTYEIERIARQKQY